MPIRVYNTLSRTKEEMDALRCNSVDVYAFATDYIDDIIAQILGLVKKGHAYVAEDGSVYYDTTTFSGWGKLSGQKVESLRPGARVAIEERKRHPADFVLWRARKPGEPAWDSPWGKGRPGWHIEDTAITIRHFAPELLDEAKRSYERLRETTRTLEAERRRAPGSGKSDRSLNASTAKALADFDAAMSDDFSTREAIAVIFDYGRAVNKSIETGAGRAAPDDAAQAFRTFGEVLGILQPTAEGGDQVERLLDLIVELREEARKRKDFAAADRIRDALAAVGVVLEDSRDGVRWKRK